jgi:hypothetical protein
MNIIMLFGITLLVAASFIRYHFTLKSCGFGTPRRFWIARVERRNHNIYYEAAKICLAKRYEDRGGAAPPSP